MQLAKIDDQVNQVKDLLTKYNYSSQEKQLKLAYLLGYVDACLAAQVISVNEHKALLLEIHTLWYSKILTTFLDGLVYLDFTPHVFMQKPL